jgi:integrase
VASVTIQKRPSGRYGVRLNVDQGRTRWVGTFDRRGDARQAGDKALADYRDGRIQGPRRMTLAKYWLETLLPLHVDGNQELAEGTRESKRMIFRAYVLPDEIASLPLIAVTNEDVRRFQVRLTKRVNRRKERLSPGSINNVLVQLTWAFNQARHAGLVPTNPCRNVPKLPESHEPCFLTDDDLRCLVHLLHRPQDARLAEFIAETGLRKGEALALTVDQVDVAPLIVWRQLLPDCAIGPLKNRRARRVGLSRRAQALMREQRAWLREEWLRQGKGSPKSSDFLWPGRRLGPMRRDTWDRAFRQAAELAELPVTTHDLRHTYAARMIDGGLDIYTLARQLGDSLAVTERIYAHLYPEAHQRAAEVLDKRREGSPEPDLGSYSVAAPPRKPRFAGISS